jgi:N6-adenosine-specific RNA methylase IME4
MTLPFHPLANIFPLIEGAEFDELVADVKANGLRDSITVHDGMVLDGRNRQRACEAAEVDCVYAPLPFEADPLAFVISKNLKRRHLNESQRAYVAAKLANLEHGGDRKSSDQAANLPLESAPQQPVSQSMAAGMLNVSERSVRAARSVQERGTPELQRAVEQGTLPVSAAAQAAKLDPDTQRKIAAEAEAGRANVVRNVIKQENRDNREKELGERQLAAPEGKFGVIVEDYEWDHETWSEAGKDRHAGNHYPTSRDAHTAEEIVRRTADRFACADDNCVLWMWTTVPHLAIALDVLRQRGFEYKSHYIWCKEHIITGYWSRAKHEVLLIGVKGNIPCPAMGTQDQSLIFAPSGEHSEKPQCIMEMIERYFPTLPKLELNSRHARPGWTVWGLDAANTKSPMTEDSTTTHSLSLEANSADERVPA